MPRKIIHIAILLLSLISCAEEIEEVPENVRDAIARHDEFVDACEFYSFGLNQHDPKTTHDSISRIIYNQINSILVAIKADDLWVKYNVGIREEVIRDRIRILESINSDISLRYNYQAQSHKTYDLEFHIVKNSANLPISRETSVYYEKVSHSKFNSNEAKAVGCNSVSEINVNGRTYYLSVHTSQVIAEK